MLLNDAVAILNQKRHRGYDDWTPGVEKVLVLSRRAFSERKYDEYLTSFEAIAIAKEYEREDKQHA